MDDAIKETSFLEDKMENSTFCGCLNFLLALTIFAIAEASRHFGPVWDSITVSPIWPATGFSLAALLLFGFKAWPGILIGNLCYNFHHLYAPHESLLIALLTTIGITSGSLLEALFAASVMKLFKSYNYFTTVRGVFIFLIPAALSGALIAATIGSVSLFLYEHLPPADFLALWTTFFVGDLMGLYIFTPLLVVWTLQTPEVTLKNHYKEAFFMGAAFIIINYLNFIIDYPLPHLYIPLAMWVTYRFKLHGATIAILLISLATIIPTSQEFQSFFDEIRNNQSLLLVTFLEVIVGISLFLAALAYERNVALEVIEHQNIDLRQALNIHVEAIKEMSKELAIKEKLSKLNLLTSHITKQIYFPLNKISAAVKSSLASLQELQNQLSEHDNKTGSILLTCEAIKNHLKSISSFNKTTEILANIIHNQATLIVPQKNRPKIMNINLLIRFALDQIYLDISSQYPDIHFQLTKNLDSSIYSSFPLHEDLLEVFKDIFRNAFQSMIQKNALSGPTYIPQLNVQSTLIKDQIEIVIRDNGLGMDQETANGLFQTFLQPNAEPPEEVINLGLSMAHDIITLIYHGTIKISAIPGEQFEIIITLEKGQ